MKFGATKLHHKNAETPRARAKQIRNAGLELEKISVEEYTSQFYNIHRIKAYFPGTYNMYDVLNYLLFIFRNRLSLIPN